MHWMLRPYSSSVGKKIVMAVSGVILFGFIIGHLIGNLQIFRRDPFRVHHRPSHREPPEVLDSYARFLKEKPEVLWTTRVILLAALGLHIFAATQLAIRNRSARPIGYRLHKYEEASYASRTMVWSGPIIGLFVIYHLLHLTLGTVHPSQPDFRAEAVYANVVSGFQQWPVALFYIVAVSSLGLHIAHGVWSMFQSVGLNHPKYELMIQRSALILSSLIVAGYVSIPLAVLMGVVS